MGDGRVGDGGVGRGGAQAGGEPGKTAGIVFVLLTVVVAWGASAVVLHQLLRMSWGVSLGAAPLLFMVALVLRNALQFRRRRRLRTQREG
jgi:hypothetical protein